MPVPNIVVLLRGISPSGPDGFEGFVADALSEVTGLTFRLVKAGPQGGADAVSRHGAAEACIAVEAKRFRASTQLPLDQLQAKLVDTAMTRSDVDLWILVASKQVSAGDVAKLEESGAAFGLDVLVLDTRAGPDGLAHLEVLCAAAPGAVERHFPGRPELQAAAALKRADDGFPAALTQLRSRLSSSDIGYDAARMDMARWMRRALGDLATAKAELGSHADLHSSGGNATIDRNAISAYLTTGQEISPRLQAVLGHEGIGKTWAVLRWWDRTAGDDGRGLPLTVWLPATRVHAGADLVTVAAGLLAGRIGTRTPAFWEARLRRWRKTAGVRLLLVVDGLNQNFLLKRWTDIFQPLFGEDWRGFTRVVVTCRPDFWEQLGGLGDLEPKPMSTTVNPFDDTELDSMLTLRGMSRDGLPAALVGLLRVPRLFALAVRLSRTIDGAGEITAETLAMADWPDRVAMHGNRIALSAADFRQLVSRLGARLKAAMATAAATDLSRRELIDELGGDSGYGSPELAGAVSELVDGRWLDRTDPHRFRLEGPPAHLAMGLSLLDVLRNVADEATATDAIADFLDPLRGADIGVAILRAAATAALVEDGSGVTARRSLLRAWHASQNFRGADFQAFWRLVALDPDLFVSLADVGWRRQEFDARQDEVMVKALANASKWERVATVVDKSVRAWMSVIPLPDGEAAARASADLSRLRKRVKLPAARLLHAEIGVDGSHDVLRKAISLCSFRKRAAVTDGYVAWALSGALSGKWSHGELVEWTLRLNREDAAETNMALVAACQELLASGSSPARAAAHRLLTALATAPAMALAGAAGPASPNGNNAAPGPSAEGHAAVWPSAAQVVLSGAQAGDPSAELGGDGTAALIGFVRTASPKELRAAFADGVTVGAIPALARWAPGEIGPYLIRLVTPIDGEPAAPPAPWLVLLAQRAVGLAGMLDPDTRAAVAVACQGVALPHRPHRITGEAATALACYGQPVRTQLEAIAASFPVGVPESARMVLKPLPSAAVLRTALRTSPDGQVVERLVYWLRHLIWSRSNPRRPPPAHAVGFLELTGHANSDVRALAMRLLDESTGAKKVAVAFAAGGWRFSPGMDQDEAAHGSLLLLKAVPTLGPGVLDRADPQVAVAAFEEDPKRIDRLARFIKAEIAHIREPGSHSSSRYWCRFEGVERFVERRPNLAARFVASVLKESRSRSTFLFMGFPIIPLCLGLLRHRPRTGARLWRSLMDEQQEGITTRGDLAIMPFKVPRTAEVDAMREHALSLAIDDDLLADIARAATSDEEDRWLEEVISRDLRAPSAAVTARALVLAGQMHATPRALKIWLGILRDTPAPGWLGAVHEAARLSFRNHVDALHWLDVFLKADGPAEAGAAYVLFVTRADWRSYECGRKALIALQPKIPPKQLLRWNLDITDSNERGRKADDEKGKLYGTTRRPSDISPWN